MTRTGYQKTKRLLDVTLSSAGLAATAPLFAAVAALIKLESDGPVFFRQERVGQHGKPFKIWKFRTMVQEAPKIGASVTAGGDPRITRVGGILRATKIDELPQLINVVLGEMSLVGPRPEVPRYVGMFADDYDVIHSVRPGITDEASITYRNEEAVLAEADDAEAMYVEDVLPKKIAMYRKYVAEVSARKDLSILLRTIWKVLLS